MSHSLFCLFLGLVMLVSPDIQLPSITADIGDTTVSGVGLGRKKKNCNKKGICVIGSDFKISEIDDRHTVARLSFSGQSLSSMFIPYSNLTENARKEYFSDTYFIMDEAYTEILKTKDNLYKINIPKGKYPINKQAKGLKITFD